MKTLLLVVAIIAVAVEAISTPFHRQKLDSDQLTYSSLEPVEKQLATVNEAFVQEGGPNPVPFEIIGGLGRPWGVAVNRQTDARIKNIVVAECDDHTISIYDIIDFIYHFGGKGRAPGKFIEPRGVTVDSDKEDNILVADSWNHRIQIFTKEGKFLKAVGRYGHGGNLRFFYPHAVAIHPHTKKLYVADSGNHRIQILNSDHTFYKNFGSKGEDDGKFAFPWDVTFDSRGNVYVVDHDNHRIQVFTSEGRFLRKFGGLGKEEGKLYQPTSAAVHSDNRVFITEWYTHRVSVFTTEGKFLKTFGGEGTKPGQFLAPTYVTIDKAGWVYITERGNGRISIFDSV